MGVATENVGVDSRITIWVRTRLSKLDIFSYNGSSAKRDIENNTLVTVATIVTAIQREYMATHETLSGTDHEMHVVI